MTAKKPQDYSVGYFKTSSLKLSTSSVPRVLARPPERRLTKQPSPLMVPMVGFVLAVLFLTGVQAGSLLTDRLFGERFTELTTDSASLLSRYEPLMAISLPAGVAFLGPMSDWVITSTVSSWSWLTTFLSGLISDAARFFNPSPPPPAIPQELIEQLRAEIMADLERQMTTSPERFSLVAVPSTGSTTQDDLIKSSLKRMFADEVEVRFDTGSSSGMITPIFRDGRRGGDYVFVLTPAE